MNHEKCCENDKVLYDTWWNKVTTKKEAPVAKFSNTENAKTQMKNNLVHQLYMLCQITRQIEANECSHKTNQEGQW